MKEQRALWTSFMNSAERFAERPAVFVEGKFLSYEVLRENALRIAATIQANQRYSSTPLTAVFAYRSPTAFAGVLGSLLAGNGYVPLNRTFPIQRTQVMLDRSECRSIIVDSGSLPHLARLLDSAKEGLLIIAPDIPDLEQYRQLWPANTFVSSKDLEPTFSWKKPAVQPDAIAYLLFTSGSTGIPKGVMVAHRNVTSFLDYMVDRYSVTEQDRLSQMFDMTFDLSVSDMFVAWERGACVCCASQKTVINPSKFLQDMKLTIWFSVPSTAAFMKKLAS